MCGIAGYVGPNSPSDVVLYGLRILEYRGYDSAGIALHTGDSIEIVKSVGYVSELATKVGSVDALAAIGHTRWATHGGVTEANAHPHTSGKVAVVHNGIVDNWKELKAELESDGVVFKSETDTEVIAHLIGRSNLPPLGAIKEAMSRIQGTYGLAILFADQPNRIYFARNGSPLVVACGTNEAYVASDPIAIGLQLSKVGPVAFLNDGDYGYISPTESRFFNLTSKAAPLIREVSVEQANSELGCYDSYMLKEINEQPDAIRRCFGGRIREDTCVLGGFSLTTRQLRAVKAVVIIGCGTSYHAGLLGKAVIEEVAGIPTTVEIASEYAQKPMLLNNKTLYLAISQSGETYDTIECIKELQTNSKNCYGIVNAVGSTIARMCGAGVYIHAGYELAVASTKAFTAQAAALYMLAIMLGRANGHLTRAAGEKLCAALKATPDQIAAALQNPRLMQFTDDMAAKIADSNYAMFLGRGSCYPVALEGALKLKEITYIACDAYPAGEMKHGPIAMIGKGTPVVALVPNDHGGIKMASNIKEVEARGANVFEIRDDSNSFTYPLFMTLPLQLLAYKVAKLRNLNIDKPRNLAKSCTTH